MVNIQDIVFDDIYTFYFHQVDDNNFSLSQFTNLGQVRCLEDLGKIMNSIQTITSGMFYLMRQDTKPLWEENKTGGFWTYKISKKEADKAWKQLLMTYVGNTLVQNEIDSKLICGVSVSPKINNCIIKIWNNDFSRTSSIDILNSIPYFDHKTALYRRHVE